MRGTKLTEELIEEATILLKEGHYVSTVTDYLGISEKTWYNWFNKGEELSNEIEDSDLTEDQLEDFDSLRLQFFQSIKKATSRAEMKSVKAILKAGNKSWQAHAWYLERKFRDKWGRPTRDDEKGGGDSTNALQRFLDQVESVVEEDDDL